MENFLEKFNLPIDMVIKIWIAILVIIIVIFLAKFISNMIWNYLEKANFLKKAFKKIWVELNLKLLWNITNKLVYFLIIFALIVWILKYFWINIDLIDNILNDYIPRFLYASWIAILAWFLATITKALIVSWAQNLSLNKTSSDDIFLVPYWF